MKLNMLDKKRFILFGSGYYGNVAAIILGRENIRYFVDNDNRKWGTKINGITIISPIKLTEMEKDYECIITLSEPAATTVSHQLDEMGIEYCFFGEEELLRRQRLLFYSHPANMEDVIIYDVLKNEKNIFYIDVGCNDPFKESVTKLLYDMLQAKGINIDPLEEMIEVTRRERPRDISICLGVGEQEGELELYAQGGLSSFLSAYVRAGSQKRCVRISTLAIICNEYLSDLVANGQQIHLMKIDVEGFEGAVIRGANWQQFRPWIVLIESTEPGSLVPTWEEWESVLLSQGYHFVMMAGVNRYYLADEHKELDKLFLSPEELCLKYRLFQATIKEIRSVSKIARPPAKLIRYAYELEGKIPVAVYSCGGLGDTIVIKRKVDELMKWDKHIVVDIYGAESLVDARRSFYSGEYQGRVNAIVDGGVEWYEVQRSKYALALSFNVDLDVDVVDEDKLRNFPLLLEKCRKLREQSIEYGHCAGMGYAIHFARCAKDKLNNYTSCNRYEGFQVDDFHTHIPLLTEYEKIFSEMCLGKYITLNVGYDTSKLDHRKKQAKAWPLDYFGKFVSLFRSKFPHIKIVQTGAADLPRVAGCDRYVLGDSLEIVKYILRGAIFHLDIEGGLVHLATQLGTKCIVLFGPTPVAYYGYWENTNLQAGGCQNCLWLVPNLCSCYRQLDEPECMFAINPEMVMDAAEKYLIEIGVTG